MSKFQENSLNNQNSQNTQTQNNPPVDQEPSWNTILASVANVLVPVMVTKLTGQKLPVNSVNTASGEQGATQQLIPILQSMVNTQNILLQEIILLKKTDQFLASNFQGLKLTHEKKQIELGTNQDGFHKSSQYNANNQNSNDYE